MNKKILTLCIIYQPPKILLAMKKRGFGMGRWNGLGGSVKKGETIEEAVKREIYEEAEIVVGDIEQVGIIEFEFRNDSVVRECHLFTADNFTGELKETEEMRPQWFNADEIPFNEMWSGDKHWFSLLLAGKKFRGRFFYKTPETDEIIEYSLKEVADFEEKIS